MILEQIHPDILEMAKESDSILSDIYKKIDEIALTNSNRILSAFIENRVSWSQIEDADCNILDTTEEQQREEKCYICDYTVFVSINGIELEEYDLREMLTKAN